MFVSTNFSTKTEFRRAVQAGLPVVAYSPIMEMPAVTGRVRVEGPWERDRTIKPWHADVVVRDMRIQEVH